MNKKFLFAILGIFLLIGFASAAVYETNVLNYAYYNTNGNFVQTSTAVSGSNYYIYLCSSAGCATVSSLLASGAISGSQAVLTYPTTLLSAYGYGVYFVKDGYIPYEVSADWYGTQYVGPYTDYLSKKQNCVSNIESFDVSFDEDSSEISVDAKVKSPISHSGPLGAVPSAIANYYKTDVNVILEITKDGDAFYSGTKKVTMDFGATAKANWDVDVDESGSYNIVVKTSTECEDMCISPYKEDSETKSLSVTIVEDDKDDDGYKDDVDCDDNDANVWRNASLYVDADKDGVGAGNLKTICIGSGVPTGYSETNSDCNDADKSIWQMLLGFLDFDKDSYGAGSQVSVCSGNTLVSGYVTNNGDCNDQNSGVHPGATEICDGMDNNCDGQIDENQVCGTVMCSQNSECGTDGYVGDLFCSNGNVVKDYKTFTCSQPGTFSSTCSADTTEKVLETCVYGCALGVCLPECSSDADCASNEECVGGECKIKDLTPSLTISANVSEGYLPLAVSFSATGTGGNGALDYYWDFGDLTFSTNEDPSHVYNSVGIYVATCVVVDEDGDSVTKTLTIKVTEDTSPTLSVSATPLEGYSPLTVTFASQGVGGNGALTYLWNFGDGTTSTLQSPTHSYTVVGTYTATCKVTDSDGDFATKTLTIKVLPDPELEIVDMDCLSSVSIGDVQVCNFDIENKLGGTEDNVNVKVYYSDGSSFGNCVTSGGACQVTKTENTLGSFTIYAMAEKTGFVSDTSSNFNYNVVDVVYSVGGLKVYNNSALTLEDSSFYRGENMFVSFNVSKNGNLESGAVSNVKLVGYANNVNFTKVSEAGGVYVYKLSPIPYTYKSIGSDKSFSFVVTFGDGTTDQVSKTLSILNNAPVIDGTIPNQKVDEGETVSINLSSYESDLEDNSSALTWTTTTDSYVTVNIVGKELFITGDDKGYAGIIVTLKDSDGATDSQTIDIKIGDSDDDDDDDDFCRVNWECSEWSACNSQGVRTRTCTDVNDCGSFSGKPMEIIACGDSEDYGSSVLELNAVKKSGGTFSALWAGFIWIFLLLLLILLIILAKIIYNKFKGE